MKNIIAALIAALLMVLPAQAAVTISPTGVVWTTTSAEGIPGVFGSVTTQDPVSLALAAQVDSIYYLVSNAGSDDSMGILWNNGSGITRTLALVSPGRYESSDSATIAEFRALATGVPLTGTFSGLPAGVSLTQLGVAGSGFAAAIPEPSRALLAFFGLGTIMFRRKRA